MQMYFATNRAAAWAVSTLLAASFAGVASAQQEYRLGDDGQWARTNEVDPTSPEGRLAEAKRTLAEGDASRAQNLASKWIERYPDHGLIAEAYLVRADALRAQSDEYEALFDYEYIARTYSGSETFVTALEREQEIAEQYAAGMNRKLWGLRIAPADDEAEELFIRVQERLPGSRLAERAGMALADFYFDRREMNLATEAYALFIQNYPHSDQVTKARKRLIYSHLARFKGPRYDATSLYEARASLEELEAVEPITAQQVGAEALLTRINESDAEKMLVTAQWYERTGDLVAAEFTIRRLIGRYPDTAAAMSAARLADALKPNLPKAIIDHMPDYSAIAAGHSGRSAAMPGAPAAGETESTTPAKNPETVP